MSLKSLSVQSSSSTVAKQPLGLWALESAPSAASNLPNTQLQCQHGLKSTKPRRLRKNHPSQLPAQQILPARSRRPKEPGTQLPQVSQSTFNGTMSPWVRNTGPHSERSGLNLFNLLRLAFQVQKLWNHGKVKAIAAPFLHLNNRIPEKDRQDPFHIP